MEQKTFHAILENFSSQPQKAKTALLDKRLTQLEKNILQGFLLIRDNDNLGAIALLKDIALSSIAFVDAHRDLVLGMAYNNLRQTTLARTHLLCAVKGFKTSNTPYFEFVTYMNLFMVNMCLKDTEQMNSYLHRMKTYVTTKKMDILRVLRCEFSYYAFIGQYDKSQDVLEEIELYKDSMTESDLIAHETNKFMNYFNLDDLEECKASLNRMTAFRKYNTTATFNYLKLLLFHLTENKPLYIKDNIFSDDPLVFNQLKLIQKFEECNFEECATYWQKLQKISPEVYRDDFSYKANKCLFSACLDKHVSKMKKVVRDVPVIKSDLPIIDRLEIFFNNLDKPISKEELYKLVWNKKVDSKDDLVLMSQAIFRLKRRTGMEIKTRKGCYYIERARKKCLKY